MIFTFYIKHLVCAFQICSTIHSILLTIAVALQTKSDFLEEPFDHSGIEVVINALQELVCVMLHSYIQVSK